MRWVVILSVKIKNSEEVQHLAEKVVVGHEFLHYREVLLGPKVLLDVVQKIVGRHTVVDVVLHISVLEVEAVERMHAIVREHRDAVGVVVGELARGQLEINLPLTFFFLLPRKDGEIENYCKNYRKNMRGNHYGMVGDFGC